MSFNIRQKGGKRQNQEFMKIVRMKTNSLHAGKTYIPVQRIINAFVNVEQGQSMKPILTEKKMKNGNCNFPSHNSDFSEFISPSSNFVSHNSENKVRIARYKLKNVKYKLLFFQLTIAISHVGLFLSILSLHLAIQFFFHHGTSKRQILISLLLFHYVMETGFHDKTNKHFPKLHKKSKTN